ncbi:thermonuclease family protein [Carnobacterium maltaromaticum]
MKVKLILVWVAFMVLSGCSNVTIKSDGIEKNSNDSSTSQEVVRIDKFTGGNFSVLPKNTRIVVDYFKKIDGDTARFKLNGYDFKTRFLLIDTPETVKRGVEPQPFGKEASERTNELLLHAATIEIEFDNGDKTDKYQRALCYVYVDNVLIQNILVSEGLARVAYVNSPNDSKLAEIKGYELIAKDAKLGIWSIANYVTERGFQE